ncbi:hypothetical protein ACN469_33830 [Corallococcus terminator]
MELQRLVLVIREQGDGAVTHSWEPADGFELPRQGTRTRLRATPVVSRPRDCDEENTACVDECMSRPLARGFGHMTSGGRQKGGKLRFCTTRCQQPYMDCVELERLRPQEFTAVDEAVDWLRQHRSEVLLGSTFIIAGVVFVVVSMGAGLLVLAPAVLFANTQSHHPSLTAEVAP